MSSEYTPAEETKILALYDELKNTNLIIQAFYGDKNLDVRSKEGRLIKSFLLRNNKKIYTNTSNYKEGFKFTEAQESFLKSDAVGVGMNPLEIARLVFNNADIQPLTKEHRVVVEWVKINRPEIIDNAQQKIVSEKWLVPRHVTQLVKKINSYCTVTLDDTKLNQTNKNRIEALKTFVSAPRVSQTINQFETEEDRELFESEFIRATWDKPDLTVDELNLYINVCTNYVRIKHLQTQINKLNKMFADATSDNEEDKNDVPIRLSEAIKAKSSELNQCEQRVEALIKKLNGDRSARLSKMSDKNVSIQSIVAAWQEEEERKKMIMLAKLQSQQVEQAANEIESMEDWKARMLGIHKEDII